MNRWWVQREGVSGWADGQDAETHAQWGWRGGGEAAKLTLAPSLTLQILEGLLLF